MKKLLVPCAAFVLIVCFVFISSGRHSASAPVKQEAAPAPPPAAVVSEQVPAPEAALNERGESVFSLTLTEFVERFDRAYGHSYLNDASFVSCSEHSPRFGYEVTWYKFSEDAKVLPMPTLSVYMSDEDKVYEVRVTYDDHSFQESLYDLFDALCTGLLKTGCPELSDDELGFVLSELYSMSNENFFGDHHRYGDPERPPLTRLIQSGSAGFYCFYGSGNVEVCMLPLTDEALKALDAEGVQIQKAQEVFR